MSKIDTSPEALRAAASNVGYEEAELLRAVAAEKEVQGWRPIGTAPKDGEFLILVGEGDWGNPDKRRTVFHAHGFPSGPSWAGIGSYWIEEGGAYITLGWMPLPEGSKT